MPGPRAADVAATRAEPAGRRQERALLARAFARLDVAALAVAVGVVSGSSLAIATGVLLIRGGELVGHHLGRLEHFLPGYEMNWLGVVVGGVEAALLGALAGALIAVLWNAYHRMFFALVLARERARDERRALLGL